MNKEKIIQYWENYRASDEAHFELMSYDRKKAAEIMEHPPAGMRYGAVLILMYLRDEEWHFALIERPEYDGVHSKQIALPGGKQDLDDRDLVHTAFRETEEEIGIPQSALELLSDLSPVYIPPSNFLVSPFVGITHQEVHFIKEEREVAQIIEVPLMDFVEKQSVVKEEVQIQLPPYRLKVNGFRIDEHFVWGATAMILNEFRKAMRE